MAQHRLRVADALVAPEVEDEGPVFFVVDESGVTFFFAGQEMARYKDRGAPGRPLSNVKLRRPLTFEEAKALGVMSAPYGK